MNSSPHVSVILAVHNAERTLPDAVESVLDQTFRDLELIVCDDASTDGTLNVLKSFEDQRLRVIRNAKNEGPGHSRDKAIAIAGGTWLAVIDADDRWIMDRLSVLLQAAGDQQDALVFDDIMECHDTPNGLAPWRRLRGPRAFSATGRPVSVPFTDFVRCRRLLIKPLFPLGLVRQHGLRHSARMFAEDTEFFLKVMAAGAGIVYVPRALYLYRKTLNSLTANPDRNRYMMEVLQDVRERFFFRPEEREALDTKIKHVARDIQYAPILAALKEGDAFRVARLLFFRPDLVGEFLRRSTESAAYRLHRFQNRAKGR